MNIKGFRVVAIGAALAVYAQIVLGGVVRITGSGLGCPDWPACQGRLVPDFANSHVVIEYAHRLTGTAAGFLMVVTAVLAVILYTQRPAANTTAMPGGLMAASLAGVGMIVIQGVLGGVTVLMGNNPFTVAIHLGNALLVLGLALLVALWAFRVGGREVPESASLRVSPIFTGLTYGSLGAAFAIVISGAYVVGAGAGAACAAWPLCGAVTGTPASDIHFLHRVVVTLAGSWILVGLVYAHQRWRRSSMALIVHLSALALVAEVAVGAAQVLSRLPQTLRAAHLALATAVWAGLVLLASAHWLVTHSEATKQRARAGGLLEARARL